LNVELVDPLLEPVPAAWDAFASEHRLVSLWRSRPLATVAWSAQTPTLMAVVADASGTPLALFHARVLGLPHVPSRFVVPGRRTLAGLVECRLHPVGSYPGYAFARGLDAAGRSAATAAFEDALRRRLGRRCPAIAYRQVSQAELPIVRRRRRAALRVQPDLVLENRWSDVDAYLATLERKVRGDFRRIRRGLDADATVRSAIERDLPAAEAARLVAAVRTRHRHPLLVQPPVPVAYFEELARGPDTYFFTYRDDGGRLLAFSTVHDNGVELLSGFWGTLDPREGGRRNLYFDEYLRTIEHMIEHGRERLRIGKGMARIKARLGATPSDRYAVVGPL
jgi:hypothetical protein